MPANRFRPPGRFTPFREPRQARILAAERVCPLCRPVDERLEDVDGEQLARVVPADGHARRLTAAVTGAGGG
jgi:hypothetical protein